MKDKLRAFRISSPEVRCLRILVHGAVGAGKSSFINSIDSIFQDRMTSGAIAAANTDHSFTKIFETHYIRDQSYHSFLPFAFCDIMGLEDGHSEGAGTEDLKSILGGHIQDGYAFNPYSPCSPNDPHYNRHPQLSDRIHCVVSVISAHHISMMDDAVFSKMKEVREQATRLRIPQVTVLTKVDDTCPDVGKGLKLVYNSKKIREQMQRCSNRLGMTMNCIFPVKCYHEEIQLNDDVDVLLLSALENILNFANDHIAVMAPPAAPMSGHSSQYRNY